MTKLKVTLPILIGNIKYRLSLPQRPIANAAVIGIIVATLAAGVYLLQRQIVQPNQLFERIVLAASTTQPLTLADVNRASLTEQHTDKIQQQLQDMLSQVAGIDAATHSQLLLSSASHFLANEQTFIDWLNAELQRIREENKLWHMRYKSFNQRSIVAGETCLGFTYGADGWQLSSMLPCSEQHK